MDEIYQDKNGKLFSVMQRSKECCLLREENGEHRVVLQTMLSECTRVTDEKVITRFMRNAKLGDILAIVEHRSQARLLKDSNDEVALTAVKYSVGWKREMNRQIQENSKERANRGKSVKPPKIER